MSLQDHSSPFNNEDNFDSSFQLETNREFNKIIESVAEREKSLLLSKNKSYNLGELLQKNKDEGAEKASNTLNSSSSSTSSLYHPLQQSPLQQQLHRKNSANIPIPREASSRRASPTKDRFSKISLVSDLSYNFPESLLDSLNKDKIVLRSPSNATFSRPGSQVNFVHGSSRRYSTISNGSSKMLIQKRSNNSLKRYGNRYSNTPKGKKGKYYSGASEINKSPYSSGIINPRMKYERSYSNDSSIIGYRNSLRSFSTAMDSTIQYFDAVSINDDDYDDDHVFDDDYFGSTRFSQLKAGVPGIVGVNIVNKNSHVNDYDDPFDNGPDAVSIGTIDMNNTVKDNEHDDLATVLSKSNPLGNVPKSQSEKSINTKSVRERADTTTSALSVATPTSQSTSSLPSPSKDILKLSFESIVDQASPIERNENDNKRKKQQHKKSSSFGSTNLLSISKLKTMNKSYSALENSKLTSLGSNTEEKQSHSRNYSCPQPEFHENTPVKRKKSFNILKASLKKSSTIKRNPSLRSKVNQNKNIKIESIEENKLETSTSINSASNKKPKHQRLDKSGLQSTLQPDTFQRLKKQHTNKPFFSKKSSDTLRNGHVANNSVSSTEQDELGALNDHGGFKFKFHKRSVSFGFRSYNDNNNDGIRHKHTFSNNSLSEKYANRNESGVSASTNHANPSGVSTSNTGDTNLFSKHNPLSSLEGSHSSNAKNNEIAAQSNDYNFLLNPEVLSNYRKIFFNAVPARKMAESNNISFMELHNLMNLCNSTNNLILEFDDFVLLRLKEMKDRLQFKKYGELKHSEIFIEQSLKSKKVFNVLKVIPIKGDDTKDGAEMLPIADAIQEMINISKNQNHNMKSTAVVKGEYSKNLLKEWDFDSILKLPGVKKKRPDFYKKNQLYLILIFDSVNSITSTI